MSRDRIAVTTRTNPPRVVLEADGLFMPIVAASPEEARELAAKIESSAAKLDPEARQRTILLVGGPSHGAMYTSAKGWPVVRVGAASILGRQVKEAELLFLPETDHWTEHLYWEMPDSALVGGVKLYEHETLREARLTGGDPEQVDYRVVEQRQAYEESVAKLERDIQFRRAEATTQRIAKEHVERELADVKAALDRAEGYIDVLRTQREDLETRLLHG
jgi:hypothetical protein